MTVSWCHTSKINTATDAGFCSIEKEEILLRDRYDYETLSLIYYSLQSSEIGYIRLLALCIRI